jgi:hypothetical protein
LGAKILEEIRMDYSVESLLGGVIGKSSLCHELSLKLTLRVDYICAKDIGKFMPELAISFDNLASDPIGIDKKCTHALENLCRG